MAEPAPPGCESVDPADVDFSGLIAQAEADIRGKLSTLDNPGSYRPITANLVNIGEPGNLDIEGKLGSNSRNLNEHPIQMKQTSTANVFGAEMSDKTATEDMSLKMEKNTVSEHITDIETTRTNLPDFSVLDAVIRDSSVTNLPDFSELDAVIKHVKDSSVTAVKDNCTEGLGQIVYKDDANLQSRTRTIGNTVTPTGAVSYIGIEITKPPHIGKDIPKSTENTTDEHIMVPSTIKAGDPGSGVLAHVGDITEVENDKFKANNKQVSASPTPTCVSSSIGPPQATTHDQTLATNSILPTDGNRQGGCDSPVTAANKVLETGNLEHGQVALETQSLSETDINISNVNPVSVSVSLSCPNVINESTAEYSNICKGLVGEKSVSNISETATIKTAKPNTLQHAPLHHVPSNVHNASQNLLVKENACQPLSKSDSHDQNMSKSDAIKQQWSGMDNQGGVQRSGTSLKAYSQEQDGSEISHYPSSIQLSALSNMVDTVGGRTKVSQTGLLVKETNGNMASALKTSSTTEPCSSVTNAAPDKETFISHIDSNITKYTKIQGSESQTRTSENVSLIGIRTIDVENQSKDTTMSMGNNKTVLVESYADSDGLVDSIPSEKQNKGIVEETEANKSLTGHAGGSVVHASTENDTAEEQVANETEVTDSNSLTGIGEMLMITDVRSVAEEELKEVAPSLSQDDTGAASTISSVSDTLACFSFSIGTKPTLDDKLSSLAPESIVNSTYTCTHNDLPTSSLPISTVLDILDTTESSNGRELNQMTLGNQIMSSAPVTSSTQLVETSTVSNQYVRPSSEVSAQVRKSNSPQTMVETTNSSSLPVILASFSIKEEVMDYQEFDFPLAPDPPVKTVFPVMQTQSVTITRPPQITNTSTLKSVTQKWPITTCSENPVSQQKNQQISVLRQKLGIPQNQSSRKSVTLKPVSTGAQKILTVKTPGKSNVVKYLVSTPLTSMIKDISPHAAVTQAIAKATAKRAPGPGKATTIITMGLQEKKREKNLKSINIDSVGVAVITDLIARKNPIPVYKPPPVPDGIISPSIIYPCFECGDTFYYAKSLLQHKHRCSMKITYSCDMCNVKKTFTNKCQLLGHLRSHMNIAKTQAVPIHIKSDSIQIESNYNDAEFWKTGQWYKEVDEVVEGEEISPKTSNKTSNVVSSDKCQISPPTFTALTCSECSEVFANVENDDIMKIRLQHFAAEDASRTRHYCGICPICLPSKCGILAHRRLHNLKDMKQTDTGPYTCPECGVIFKQSALYNFLIHLKQRCCHFSRRTGFQCSKCIAYLNTVSSLRNHLMITLQHYYKCSKCPMALKSVKTFENHFNSKHLSSETEPSSLVDRVKIIYRCHVCDTLIDDKSFLLSHIDRHIDEIKQRGEYRYHCLQCGLINTEKSGLTLHMETCSHTRREKNRPSYCTFCRIDKITPVDYMHHIFECHFSKDKKGNAEICSNCGIVCFDKQMLLIHANKCLAKDKVTRVLGDAEAATHKSSDVTKTKPRSILPAPPASEKATQAEAAKISDDLSPVCVSCLYDFTESDSLRTSHVLAHRQEGVNICLYCDKMDFLDDNDLVKHENNCRSENIASRTEKQHEETSAKVTGIGNLSQTCLSCNYTFKSKGNRSHHIRAHRSDNIFICLHCDRMDYQSRSQLRNHEIACSMLAGRKFEQESPLDDKTNNNKPASKLQDKITLKISKGIVGRNNMVKEPTFLVQYKCDQCDEMFNRKDKQEEHKRLEHGIHPCHLCGLMYESHSSLKQHLTISHEGKKLVYYCWVCRERKISNYFSNVSHLEKHLSSKHRMKNWDTHKMVPELPGIKGKIVGPEPVKRKSVAGSGDMAPVKRLRVEGDKSFKCAKCAFSCEIREDFLKHITDHKTENTVQCIECGLCFMVMSSLKKHLFMVHKVRDFDGYIKEHNIEDIVDEVEEEILSLDDEIEREPVEPPKVQESSDEETSNPLECKVCYKKFDTEHSLKCHMRVHGMAFIKKSRRRAMSLSPPKKKVRTDSECSSRASVKSASSSDGKDDNNSDNVGGQENSNDNTKAE